MKEPIRIYKNDEELKTSLLEWKDKLGLQNWYISVELVNDIPEEPDAGGICQCLEIQKTARIRLLESVDHKTFSGKRVAKQPQELTLVHELLHCVMLYPRITETASYESVMSDGVMHSWIDTCAKTMILAKYNLDYEWLGTVYD